MPASAGKAPPTVFISYAHEKSDALRVAVATLADWLRERGCEVLTDHPYVDRPPPEGWQAWMGHCIQEADIVLVVCTPRLKARYEKTAPPSTGRGATYEGAIVTQYIYDDAMRNTKFFPILPDGGSVDDVPTFLRPWCNWHFFPSGNAGIGRMVSDEAAGAGSPAGSPSGSVQGGVSPWPVGAHHGRMAARLLGAPEVGQFLAAVQRELAEEFGSAPPVQTAAETVRRFSECPAEQVQPLFFVVRRALQALPLGNRAARGPAEEAAAALYCLAACRLVDKAAHEACSGVPGACAHVLEVPSGEHVVCAVIATALFGGELRLRPDECLGLPSPEYVFEVRLPAGGDQVEQDFERAVYTALFANVRTTPEFSLDSGPLSDRQRADLAAELADIRNVHRASLALVVKGLTQAGPCQGFATEHQVPVMLPTTEATTALLGMTADRLVAEIRLLWAQLEDLPRPAQPTRAQTPASEGPGAPAMNQPTFNVRVEGGSPSFSMSTGGHSVAQSGTGHTASVDHREGADLSALLSVLQEITHAIGELPSAKARDRLGAHARTAQAQAGKADRTDPGAVERALDAIRSGAEVLEQGGTIVSLCHKAYQALAPFLGLPSAPLP